MRENKKTVKIISEMLTFFLNYGAADINIDFSLSEEEDTRNIVIMFKGHLPGLTASQLKELEKDLRTPRETQVEEYYWELAGEGSRASELSLIGMLTDRALVEYNDSILEITLWRRD